MNHKIAVLIPCYNESKTIATVVSDFKKQLPEAEIYVYDNNSTDNTADIARQAGAIVRYEQRQGKGNVVRRMLADIEADCYLLVDGDDTYPSDNAKEMCDIVLNEHYDMVIGDRLSSTYFQENKRPFHDYGNRFVRYAINQIFHSDIKDIMTGYRALSRHLVMSVPLLSEGFEIETELTINVLDNQLRIKQIPVEYRDRPIGSTSKLSTFKDGIKIIATIFRLFRDYKPLVFFSWISSILILASLLILLPVFIEYLQTGLVPRFPTLIVCGFIILFAILLWMCGLILQVLLIRHRQLCQLLNKKIIY
jgi:glycosyltransferase involved in cell wall biosynthesis